MSRTWTRPAAWCVAGVLAVAVNPTTPRAADQPAPTKRLVELPTKSLVANAVPANPTIEAGKVKWHPSLADACATAKKTGKPVLVFHMMGQLDKQFC
jgi:hypothetical protein